MSTILNSHEIEQLDQWAERLADLTRIAWTGADQRCYFPYQPLITAEFWQTVVADDWHNDRMHSWAMLHGGQLVAHAALVGKNGYWELGRWVALPDAPHGAVTQLCGAALKFIHQHNLSVQVECTQAHTSSQFICEQLGFRFAGIGILTKLDGIFWDIIYFDNLKLPPFEPCAGLLGNPQGQKLLYQPEYRERLAEISTMITTVRGGGLPPTLFHTLPHLVEPIRCIIELNR
ncbi:hypothetical protein KKF05_04390 [Patescibacteria group bacterium]|nr:hypothetical protein [Patescibacteria group bacterium]MBU1029182.1 hypothetical protein [Patescibacteria group bacterium]MBU1916293.1 hypothetical protein [Patescibacteria group bacterium]